MVKIWGKSGLYKGKTMPGVISWIADSTHTG